MYISHKSNVLQTVHETEWQCRRNSKGQTKPEYWTWLDSVTSGDPPVVDYSGETGYTIVEVTDEDVQARLNQLGDYVDRSLVTGIIYNIKWSDDIGNAEEILDNDGNSHDPKQYVQSHLKGDDTAKTARLLAEEWTRIRAERDRLLTESDWTQGNDTPLSDADKAKWTTYRASLRTLPVDQSSKTTYASITWPDKP
jgi:hypothetical protein